MRAAAVLLAPAVVIGAAVMALWDDRPEQAITLSAATGERSMDAASTAPAAVPSRVEPAVRLPVDPAPAAPLSAVPSPGEAVILPAHPAPAEPLPATSRASPARAKAAQAGVHKVVRGDTLWSISKRRLGTPFAWPALVEENASVVRDPDLIRPGQRLEIPARQEETRGEGAERKE